MRKRPLTADSFSDPVWAVVHQGYLEHKSGNLTRAIDLFNAAIRAFTRDTGVEIQVEAHICRGAAYGDAVDLAAAFEDFSRAIELNPGRDLAYYNRGLNQEQRELYREAIADYSRAIDLCPTKAYFYLRRGMCYKRLNQSGKAREDFAAVRRLKTRRST